ncbi:MAG: TetR/AcrR family transcriptional regulator [Blastomonas sp.]|jgi:AcrR family transcriptional regulator
MAERSVKEPRETGAPVRRRRGAALEQAILDVTWQVLREADYSALTLEAVALRAGTSRPVIARRWSTRAELVLAAIRHRLLTHPLNVPDLGNVREELIEFLKQSVERGWPFAMMFTCQMGDYFTETRTNLHQLRSAIRSADENAIFNILHRAVQRGEVDGRKLTPNIVRLPKDLLFNNAMMTLKPTSDDYIVELVDTIFLPLVRA